MLVRLGKAIKAVDETRIVAKALRVPKKDGGGGQQHNKDDAKTTTRKRGRQSTRERKDGKKKKQGNNQQGVLEYTGVGTLRVLLITPGNCHG